MSGVPPVARIPDDAIKGAPSWASVLVRAINALVDYLTQTLGKGVTIDQNLAGSGRVELEVRTSAEYDDAEPTFTPVRFKANLGNQRAAGCLVLKVTDLDYPNAVLTGPFCATTWEQQGDEILVRWISGLEASHRYSMRFWTPV